MTSPADPCPTCRVCMAEARYVPTVAPVRPPPPPPKPDMSRYRVTPHEVLLRQWKEKRCATRLSQ